MEATLPAHSLRSTLTIVKPAATYDETHQPGVCLLADDIGLTVSAGNPTGVHVSTDTAAIIGEEGSVWVNHGLLSRLLSSAGSGDVTIRFDADKDPTVVTVATGVATFRIGTFPAPDQSEIEGVWSDAEPVDVGALRAVLPAAAVDQCTPMIESVLIDGDTMVATDKYRIHIVRSTGNHPAAIVPIDIARPASRSTKLTLSVSEDRRYVRLSSGRTKWTARCPVGNYPDWRKLVPAASDDGYEVDGAAMRTALTVLAPMYTGSGIVDELVSIGAAGVAVGNERGEADAAVPFKPYGTPPDRVWFNGGYLLALIEGIDRPRIDMTDQVKAIAVRHTDADGREHTRLLMPVRHPS